MDRQDTHYESNTPLHQLQPERMTDGEHAVWTSPEGVRLSVEVRGGKVVRWRGKAPDGSPVDVTVRKAEDPGQWEKAPASREDVPFPQPQRPPIIVRRCYACYSNPLPTGPRLLCYEVPCYD